jgi:hypothetical protein
MKACYERDIFLGTERLNCDFQLLSVEDFGLLGSNVVLVLSLNIEDGGDMFSETSVSFQRATRRHITEDRTLHNRRCENLKSHIPNFGLLKRIAMNSSEWAKSQKS